MKTAKEKAEWKNGYEDGSGKGTITFKGEGKLRVHWGCSCCDSWDSFDDKNNKKGIKLADKIVKILNEKKVKP